MLAHPKVLVVGAGPIGLMLAVVLARYGIDITVIDKVKRRGHFSRALTLTSASLKLFQGLDIANPILEAGKKSQRVEIFFNKKRAAFLDKKFLLSQFNYYLSIPQPVVENILEQELERLGVSVKYGHELVSLEQTDQYVTAKYSINNYLTTGNFDYVVGCDGAHSTVRKLLNIPFSGPDYPVYFLLADLKFKENNFPKYATYYVEPDGFMGFFPMNSAYSRVVIQKNEALTDDRSPASIYELQSYLEKYLPQKLTIIDCAWSTKARVIGRLSPKCQEGRVFLAGDAWHLFSPVGGQTMNTGFQDAFDLGWKLAYTLQGKMKANLLNTYEIERSIAAKKVLTITDYYTNLIIDANVHKEAQKCFTPDLKNRLFFKQTLPYLFSGYHADYQHQKNNIVGQHVPYFKLQEQKKDIKSTYDLPKLKKYTLFFLKSSWDLVVDFTTSPYANFINLIEVNSNEQQIARALFLNQYSICLVSPGGYIAAQGNNQDIKKYFKDFID
jgi:2-polyprenyl-6-methoxyphenol hydroxylase-like FAD-dependent oxidoreductase